MALLEAALEATDLRWAAVTAGILEAALAILAAAFGTGASGDLDLASMDTWAGSTPITAMAPVWCPLLTATPGLATDIQHRNLLSALHRNGCGAFTNPWAGNKTAALRGLRRHSATYGDVTRHIACLRRRLSRVELVEDAFFCEGRFRAALITSAILNGQVS